MTPRAEELAKKLWDDLEQFAGAEDMFIKRVAPFILEALTRAEQEGAARERERCAKIARTCEHGIGHPAAIYQVGCDHGREIEKAIRSIPEAAEKKAEGERR